MKRGFLVFLILLFFAFEVVISQGVATRREETLIVEQAWDRAYEPGNFNVFTVAWRSPQRGVWQLMTEALWVSDTARGQIINALASDPPIYSNDFKELIIKLRRGIYWSDGVEFTADDVVFAIRTTMKFSGMAYHSEFNRYIKEVEKVDKYTVRITLKEPNSRFHVFFVEQWDAWRPFPKHIFEKVEDPVTFTFNPPVSLGPYVLKSYDPAGYWTLWERREDWFRTVTGQLFGMPKPKYVLFTYHGTIEGKILAMTKHELDIAYLSPEAVKVVLMRNKFARAFQKSFPWLISFDTSVSGIKYNTDVYPFNLRDVRWALVLAIDIVDAASVAYDGGVILEPLPLPPIPSVSVYYEALRSWLRDFSIEVDGQVYKVFDPNIPIRLVEYAKKRGYDVPKEMAEKVFGPGWWKYAPDVAEKLLLKNGFKRDKTGKWLLPDGRPWQITLICSTDTTSSSYKNALAVARQWRRFGIDVVLKPAADLSTALTYGNFEVAGGLPFEGPWGGHHDLYKVFWCLHTNFYKPIGEAATMQGNHHRWHNPKMNAIIEKMEKLTWDDPAIIDLGIEGLKLLVEEMPSIPMWINPLYQCFDEYYWTNYPSFENPYMHNFHCAPNFKYVLPFLEATGRK